MSERSCPIQEGLYMEYQLSYILLDGHSFNYFDDSRPTADGYVTDTKTFCNDIVDHYLENTYFKNRGEWYGEGVETIQQLTDYINRLLSQSKSEAYKEAKRAALNEVLLNSIIVVVVVIALPFCRNILWI